MLDDPRATMTMFDAAHCGALLCVAGVSAACAAVLRVADGESRSSSAVRRAVCWTLAALLIGSSIVEQFIWIATGSWDVRDSLPLHLCDWSQITAAVALLMVCRPQRGSRTAGVSSDTVDDAGKPARGWTQMIYELTYYWGLGGTTQALLTPDIDDTFPTVVFFTFFAAHGAILVAVFTLTIGLRMRPRPWSAFRVWLITICGVLPLLAFNTLTGANYMFLNGPPANPSIYDYFGDWPLSLLTLIVATLAMMTLCYSPYWVMDRLRRARASSSNA